MFLANKNFTIFLNIRKYLTAKIKANALESSFLAQYIKKYRNNLRGFSVKTKTI